MTTDAIQEESKMGKFKSRGHVHHASSTATCPDCGRRFQTHTIVGEDPDGFLALGFKSKQTGRWGVVRVPLDQVVWAETKTEAWRVQREREGR